MTEEIKFERALERLEKIVEDLESGNLSLEDALKRYEEGIRLSRACQRKLTEAEKKIEILTRSLDGSLKRQPFDSEGDTSSSESEDSLARQSPRTKKTGKAPSGDGSAEDGDLLF